MTRSLKELVLEKVKARHLWTPIKESKSVYGYHMYKCGVCGKETHIGLDIDYEAVECPGDPYITQLTDLLEKVNAPLEDILKNSRASKFQAIRGKMKSTVELQDSTIRSGLEALAAIQSFKQQLGEGEGE